MFSDADFAAIIGVIRMQESASRNSERYFEALIRVLDERGVDSEEDRERWRALQEAAEGARSKATELAADRERWERMRVQDR